jgi:MtN3 and saliva related transmembrane protein
MVSFVDALGWLAAFLTTAANVPQVIKCVRTGKADDLSMKMLLALSAGFSLWLTYGVLRGDLIIAIANGISLCLISVLVVFKRREHSK